MSFFLILIFFSYPKTFTSLPLISFYEINNSIYAFAEDAEYASEINYVIDIWANSSDETNDIALLVNEKMNDLGFIREVSYDIPDENVAHKFMRFKIII